MTGLTNAPHERFRHAFAIGLGLLILFKLWLVHAEDIYGSATEYDALWYISSAKNWYWGSPYSWTAFVRPPAYPLFIALVHLGGIPLRIAIELLQISAYLVLVTAIHRAAVPRAVCLLAFTVMLFHPGSFVFNNHTMSDSFYAAILPLALGGLLLVLFTGKLRHTLWTGAALGVLWNTREESILILAMLAVFFAVALFRDRARAGSWKAAAHSWIKPAAAMLTSLALLVLAVGAANYRTFHSFSKSEMTSSSFRAAYKALLRIKPSRQQQRFVSVSTEALEAAYAISPTFAQLKPQFEGDLGRAWQVPAVGALGIQEIGAPWFFWALRSIAANSGDIHASAANADRFYRDVALEINRACDEGRVPHRPVLSSFLDPGALANFRYLPESFSRIAGLFLLKFERTEGRDDAILTPSQSALYDEMTGRRPASVHQPGLSVAIENFIGRYHPVLVAGLSLIGLAALLIVAWHWRDLHRGDRFCAALILLGTAILLRVTLFSYLDATWWIGGYDRYLFPVMPLYSAFLILLIYRAWITWRKRQISGDEVATENPGGLKT